MKRTYEIKRVNHNAECWVEAGGFKWQLQPDESQKLRNHSPDGFEFGYSGSGPAQLALAILLDYCRAKKIPEATALEHYRTFKEQFIAAMGLKEGTITDGQLQHFLEQQAQQQTTNQNPS